VCVVYRCCEAHAGIFWQGCGAIQTVTGEEAQEREGTVNSLKRREKKEKRKTLTTSPPSFHSALFIFLKASASN